MKFLSLSLVLFSVSAMAYVPPARMDRDAYLQINSNDRDLYATVRAAIPVQAAANGFYPIKFSVDRSNTNVDQGVCAHSDTVGVKTTLLYRDDDGALRGIQYIVCDGAGKKTNEIVNMVPSSDGVAIEQNFKHGKYVAYSPNKTDCGESKVVTQTFCAPGYAYYAFIDDNATGKSSGSTTTSIVPNAKDPKSCVDVTAKVEGQGKDQFGICKEPGTYNYTLDIFWTSSDPITKP